MPGILARVFPEEKYCLCNKFFVLQQLRLCKHMQLLQHKKTHSCDFSS